MWRCRWGLSGETRSLSCRRRRVHVTNGRWHGLRRVHLTERSCGSACTVSRRSLSHFAVEEGCVRASRSGAYGHLGRGRTGI
eukprot:2583322-Pleurochrysis_carterae.AAC.1